MQEKSTQTEEWKVDPNPAKIKRDVVVVGASAGGVESLQSFAASLPASFPAAVLAVLHIPAHSPSQLHRILARAGPLPVYPAEDGELLCGGRIYVAPADRHLMLDGEYIRLTRGPKESRNRPAVDVLFRSAAHSYGARVIGIVLSGMLDDGTAGLWAIKDRGGIAMVQSPAEALYPSMPQSALEHVAVDYVLPVAEMPAVLAELTNEVIEMEKITIASDALALETKIALEGNALQGGVMQLGQISPNTCPDCHGVLVKIEEGSIVRFRCHTGHAFSLQTLLAEVDEAIDLNLWNTIRVIEERMLLLRQMAQLAQEEHADKTVAQYSEQAHRAEQQVAVLRRLVLTPSELGQ
jgi:two-component system, chemotaxis family, protein-glutamate methylesterase/glutaminase